MSELATLGGGCFWCLEAVYLRIKGVKDVVSGYAGGDVPDPTYDQVVTGMTGHAEVVRVEFDPTEIRYREILDVFWAIHDPTTLNRQGYDVGTEYRSVIFYENEEQRKVAEESKAEVQKLWEDPVVTEVAALEKFWPAEELHQRYFDRNPSRAYCQIVINPKLEKLRQSYQSLLKKDI